MTNTAGKGRTPWSILKRLRSCVKAHHSAHSGPVPAPTTAKVGIQTGSASSAHCSPQGLPTQATNMAAAHQNVHSSNLPGQSTPVAGMLPGAAAAGQPSPRGPSALKATLNINHHLAHSSSFSAQATPEAPAKGRSASPGPSSPRGPHPPAAAAATEPALASDSPFLADGQVPIQPAAVAEYVKYGEMCQLTYDSFRNKAQATGLLATPRPGESGFTETIKKNSMDQLINLLQPNSAARSYQVVDFLYANSGWDVKDSKDSDVISAAARILKDNQFLEGEVDKLENFVVEQHNWIGYMAVGPPDSEGLHDVAVVFRGTQTSTEWADDFDAFLVPAHPWTQSAQTPHGKEEYQKESGKPTGNPRVANGFKRIYAHPSEEDPNGRTSPHWQVHETLMALQKDPQNKIGSITFTGHSLGAALATLAAYDIAQDSCRGSAKVRAVTFAGPKVGDVDFVTKFEKLETELTRVVNLSDIVPQVPGVTEATIKQLFGALPSGAKATVTAKPGDDDFKEKVINAAKGAGLVLGSLMAYLSKTELFAGPLLGAYLHIGPALTLDSTKVSVMKQEADVGLKLVISCWHNLEGYLYMLDPSRDPCLINKGGDCLKPNNVHGKTVPPNWWGDGPGTPVPPTCPVDH